MIESYSRLRINFFLHTLHTCFCKIVGLVHFRDIQQIEHSFGVCLKLACVYIPKQDIRLLGFYVSVNIFFCEFGDAHVCSCGCVIDVFDVGAFATLSALGMRWCCN